MKKELTFGRRSRDNGDEQPEQRKLTSVQKDASSGSGSDSASEQGDAGDSGRGGADVSVSEQAGFKGSPPHGLTAEGHDSSVSHLAEASNADDKHDNTAERDGNCTSERDHTDAADGDGEIAGLSPNDIRVLGRQNARSIFETLEDNADASDQDGGIAGQPSQTPNDIRLLGRQNAQSAGSDVLSGRKRVRWWDGWTSP